MRLAAAILLIGGLVFLAHFFAHLFSRTRIPDVLWLLLIGVGLGPVSHLLSPEAFGVVGPAFVAITLVLILFESGLSLQFQRLRRALPGTLALSTASFIAEAAIVGAATWWLTPLGWRAILLGIIVAGNSPTVIVPLAKGLRMGDHIRDILFLESALGDVVSIVLALALLDFHFNGWSHWFGTTVTFVLGFGGAVVLGSLAGLAWALALRKTRGLENPMFTTPAFVFMVYGAAELLHANGAIAALAFGIILGNVEGSPLMHEALPAEGLNPAEMSFLSEIVFLLKTFFFVYIGLSIRFTDLRWLALGAGLTALLLVARVPAVRFALPRHAASLRDTGLAACMIPKGLAAAVLAALLVEQKVPGAEELQSVVYSIIFFGVVFTSILVFFANQRFGGRTLAWLLGRGDETDLAVSASAPNQAI